MMIIKRYFKIKKYRFIFAQHTTDKTNLTPHKQVSQNATVIILTKAI